jgi:antitoxin Phd
MPETVASQPKVLYWSGWSEILRSYDLRQVPRNSRRPARPAQTADRRLPSWKLQDAKTHFSQVVRDARARGPQRVTVHGNDAVVVLSAEEYARLAAARPSLHELLSSSPLCDLDFEHEGVRSPVRDVEL